MIRIMANKTMIIESDEISIKTSFCCMEMRTFQSMSVGIDITVKDSVRETG